MRPNDQPRRSRKNGCGFFLAIGILLAVVGWANRDAIIMRLYTRAVDAAMSRNVMAGLDPKALHVGFCGTGAPLPNRDRGEACTVVIAGGRLFVFDAGEGAGRTLSLMGMPLGKVEGVWLTHMHSDHFNGLGNLALQRWAGTSAATPLPVFGPEGVTDITESLTRAYKADSTYRIAHHGADIIPPSGFGFAGKAVAPGVVYDGNGVRITAFAVDHAPVAPAFGYRLDWNGRSVTISGDTKPSLVLAAAAKGSDLLVSELLSPRMVKILEETARRTGQANRAKIMSDIQDYHIAPEAAADAAKAAGVKLLAFTHVVPATPRFMDSAVMGDARGHFEGPVWIMRDGDLISISAEGKPKRENLLP
jgi:ribonuclease Z